MPNPVLIAVPPHLVSAVAELIANDGQTAAPAGQPGDTAFVNDWSEAQLRQHYIDSSENMRAFLRYLADHADEEVTTHDAAKAIGYYERILELDPFYTAALDSLEKLYEREGRFRDLAALLEQRLKTATEAESVEIKLSLGSIYLDRLHEPEGSLGHLEDVLQIRQNDPKARELVERLLDIGALRLRAASVRLLVHPHPVVSVRRPQRLRPRILTGLRLARPRHRRPASLINR